jgi:hypothetical protein
MDYAKQIERAGDALADAVKIEMTLEDTRPQIKFAAIERLMAAGDNPLTGKPHSFSSAEAQVHIDQTYMDFLARVREATVNRIRARAQYEAALAQAQIHTETAA